MIGSEALAQFIASIPWWGMEDVNGDLDPADAPEGWEYIGSGAHRHAFKGPDGFVYKVRTNDAIEEGIDAAEEQDWAYHKFVKGLQFEGFRFAEIDYFADCYVGVAEFINGTRPTNAQIRDLSHRVFAAFNGEFNTDIHCGNIIVENGEFVVIDF